MYRKFDDKWFYGGGGQNSGYLWEGTRDWEDVGGKLWSPGNVPYLILGSGSMGIFTL